MNIDSLIEQKKKGLEFLTHNELYFENHGFYDISDELISQIEVFSNCSILYSVWPTNTSCKKIVDSAQKFVYCIFTQPPFLMADTFYLAVKRGVDMRFLFGENSDIPDCNDLVEKLHLDKPSIDSVFEKRICDSVGTNLVVSEVGGVLMLPDNAGVTDMTMGISGFDDSFVDWCKKFFHYKWNAGKQFARLRQKV